MLLKINICRRLSHTQSAFVLCCSRKTKKMRTPGFEPGISRPQREVLTTILCTPGEAGHRSQYLLHAKQALYHLSYIPVWYATYPKSSLIKRSKWEWVYLMRPSAACQLLVESIISTSISSLIEINKHLTISRVWIFSTLLKWYNGRTIASD